MGKLQRTKNKKNKKTTSSEFTKLKKWIIRLIGICIFLLSAQLLSAEEAVWRSSGAGISENRITSICVMKGAPGILLAGTNKGIYRSTDSGKNWERVFMVKGQSSYVNAIHADQEYGQEIFAATSDGLYVSKDNGSKWQISFKGKDELQRNVVDIIIDKNSKKIFIATKRGLFYSKDKGRNWSAENTFRNKEVASLAVNNGNVYVCVQDGVYCKIKNSNLWDRVYVAKAYENEDPIEDSDNGDFDEEERVKKLKQVVISNDSVYLATDKGILVTKSNERNWSFLTDEGLLAENIKYILPIKETIFAATDKGIFYFNTKRGKWDSISTGLMTPKVNKIVIFKNDKLLAATEKGIYISSKVGTVPYFIYASEIFKDEPSILDVQQAAISYCEVSPEKIKWMRSCAMNKAWLPDVSFGIDGDNYRTIDLDRGGTNDPDFYIEGPRDRNFGWNVDLSWDLGELIWNSSQTSIDVRSRLMVQLRNDILDEANKLYFERRRLQLELQNSPPENTQQKMLKELRLAELTASIDALTGGYFSANINKQ